MNYVIAENKYITYLRDGGWRGELDYRGRNMVIINANRQEARHSITKGNSKTVKIDRRKIPKHLRHLTNQQLTGLAYLFRGGL